MTSLSPAKAGVIGWPVKHSLSPRLHGFWLRHYGIQGSYEALPVEPENLASALRGLGDTGFSGVNLTVPHKQAACAMMSELDDNARRIGAINLVTVRPDGKLRGSNTDAYGFRENLLTCGFTPKGGAALVLGAGGAARAILVALQDMGFSSIRIANRTLAHAEKLAHEFSTPQCSIQAVEWAKAEGAAADIELLVNTTSLGMEGQPDLLFSLDQVPISATVTDIVYAPLETPLLRRAKQRGNAAIDGLGMLLHQARPSFAAFFGRDPEMSPEVTAELREFVLEGR